MIWNNHVTGFAFQCILANVTFAHLIYMILTSNLHAGESMFFASDYLKMSCILYYAPRFSHGGSFLLSTYYL